MLIKNKVAVHAKKDSPKEPDAQFSIYFQPSIKKFGLSWRNKNGSSRVYLLQKIDTHWHAVRVKGVGLRNDESVD